MPSESIEPLFITPRGDRVIVVVTGSRDYTDYRHVATTLSNIHKRRAITEIRHGAAPGADALASQWAYEHQVDVNAFGAKWGQFGPSAGPFRNVSMLDTQPPPDLVVGFPTVRSRGTWQCLNAARERGIETYVPEKRISRDA